MNSILHQERIHIKFMPGAERNRHGKYNEIACYAEETYETRLPETHPDSPDRIVRIFIK